MKRPILIVGLLYLIGTLIAIITEKQIIIAIVVSLALLITIAIKNIKTEIKIALFFMVISISNYSYRYYKNINFIDEFNGSIRDVTAIIEQIDIKYNYVNVKIKTKYIDNKKVNINTILKLYDENVEVGDEISAKLKFSKIKNSKNFDSINFYKSQNIFLNSSILELYSIKRNNKFIGKLNEIKYKVAKNNKNILSNDTGDFVNAITLGLKNDLSDEIKNVFNITGTSHIFALSGLHISIIGICIFYLLKYLKFYKYANILTIIFLFLYYFMINNSFSMLRAIIMFSIFLIADLLNRYNDSLSSLSLAFIIILILNPFSIFSIGFLLSFLSVLGIMVASFKINVIDLYCKNKLLNYILKSIYISTFINIFTLPVVSLYFGKFNIFSPIFNIIVLFLFTPILILSFIFTIFSFLSLNFITYFIGIFIHLFLTLLITLISNLSNLISFFIILPSSFYFILMSSLFIISLFLYFVYNKYLKYSLICTYLLFFSYFI